MNFYCLTVAHMIGAGLLSRPLIGCLAPDALSAATRRLGGPVPIGGADGKKGALNMEVKAFAGIDVVASLVLFARFEKKKQLQ